MGRTRKDELTGEAASLAKRYDDKITEMRRMKEKALKVLAEKQKKELYRMSEKIMRKLREICGDISRENVDMLVQFMEDNREQLSACHDKGKGQSDENGYIDIADYPEQMLLEESPGERQ